MKKCVANVIYRKNHILNITINYKCNMIDLQYCFDPEKKYKSFQELHNAVLKILKNIGKIKIVIGNDHVFFLLRNQGAHDEGFFQIGSPFIDRLKALEKLMFLVER